MDVCTDFKRRARKKSQLFLRMNGNVTAKNSPPFSNSENVNAHRCKLEDKCDSPLGRQREDTDQ